jgi:hypothetical protein
MEAFDSQTVGKYLAGHLPLKCGGLVACPYCMYKKIYGRDDVIAKLVAPYRVGLYMLLNLVVISCLP